MAQRINYFTTAPKAMAVLLAQEEYLGQEFKDKAALWELIKLRVSQINQCAYCIDMHSKDALSQGESVERLYGLSAWREMPFYSDLEKSALSWAELIISGEPVSDIQYQSALSALGEQGLVDLTVAVNAINSWNRIGKAFKPDVGDYKPRSA
ncbi:carboxymuconolactone decarboxylase family protein [uncultured Shewanella sp.]|uniref:carboxymuconolactone decarboxylase family protein n=1 Tax=uncultured Shewanella sp. TaxID=173975 RepID=UPI00260AB21A|nr:carboxymuconolactone decarboxylase family protein [uncultured Shewanella sp.]